MTIYIVRVYLSENMYGPAIMITVPDGEHKHIPRVVVTILITNADNATMQLDDPHYDGLFNLS